jgi:hypothetical protein
LAMRMILKYLLDNAMVEFTSKEIAKSIKHSGISYNTSRLKAFIMDNKDVSDILKVRVAKGRESVFMCKAESIDNSDEWATRYYNDYLVWERGQNVKGTNPRTATRPKEDEKEISVPAIPVSFVYNNGKPVEMPINLKITISIKVEQS